MGRNDELHCSFCNKTSEAVRKLISNPNEMRPRSYICDECIATCVEILDENEETKNVFLFCVEPSRLARIQTLGLLSVEALQDLTKEHTLGEFLGCLKAKLDIALNKLGEIEKTELGQQVRSMEAEVAQQSRDLEKKKTELESLRGRLAKVSKTSCQ